ncbi:MAG: hypothetical protein AB4080_23925 [Trichodesmium sp.]
MKTKFSSLIKHFALGLVIGLASISLLITNASTAFADSFLFFAENNCTEDIVANYDYDKLFGEIYIDIDDNCRETSRCKNDEARSLLIKGPAEDTTVALYDNPDGDTDDDYSVINIRSVSGGDTVCVGTFEKDYDYGEVKVYYRKDNGLDGRVSHIEIGG